MLSVLRFFGCAALPILALLAADLTMAATAQQTRGLWEQPQSSDIRCVLEVDNRSWQPGKPAVVSVQLENLTDRDLEFNAIPEFDLSPTSSGIFPTPGVDEYWAPTDIVESKPIKTRSVGISGLQPVPIKLRLAKRSVTVLQVDATRTHWQRTISSNWPDLSLYGVERGAYLLRLGLEVNGQPVRSNGVKIVIGKDDLAK